MPIYAIVGEASQTFCNAGDEPSGAIQMSVERPSDSDYVAQADGTWAEDVAGLAAKKRQTIVAFLPIINFNLMLHDESNAPAVGTRTEWVTFMEDLWTIHQDTDANVIAATIPTQPS